MKPIEIFKVGTHTAMSGQSMAFDKTMLSDAVAAYKPDLHEAPIVVGHPKDNHPAFGWIDHLELTDDGIVLAHPKQVDSDFAELVKDGKYKKRSASWYSPDSPANPTPGKLYLRHVGFLGAMPPAIKGLGDIQFNEAEEGILEFAEISPYTVSSIGSIFRRMRDWLISKDGLDAADKLIPDYEIRDIEDQARRMLDEPKPVVPISNFSEDISVDKDAEINRLKQELEQAKQAKTVDFSEQENTLKQREAQIAKREIGLQLDDLISKGKVLPAQKAGLIEFMACLDSEQTIDFSEGGKTVKQSAREFMQNYLGSMPKIVEFGEVTPADGLGTPQELSATELAAKAQAYHQKQSAAGQHISFSEAVAAVQAGKE